MSMQHTPGPWEVRLSNRNPIRGSFCPADVLRPGKHVIRIADDASGDIDAYLIAAAPELLACAKDLLQAMTERGLLCECAEPECRTTRLRAAITKATGSTS